MHAEKAPIFVCGLGRSGTTWVAEALGQSPEVTYIKEAWLIGKLQEMVDWYKTIHGEWGDFVTWKSKNIPPSFFINTLSKLYAQMLYSAAKNHRFVEKTPEWNVFYLNLLVELFPDAYYILIYRDGRNCVASYEAHHQKRNKNFDFAETCHKWLKSMELFRAVKKNNNIKKYKIVRYEDLLNYFPSTFEGLCNFVKIQTFTPKRFVLNSAFKKSGEINDFNYRWKTWSKDKKKTFKKIAGVELVKWGYEKTIDSW